MRSPLAHRARDLAALTRDGITVVEVPFLAQVDVRVGATELALPREANTTLGSGERSTLWLGPDEWLVTGSSGTAPSIIQDLTRALAGAHASLIDVSANRAVIDLIGPGARDLLAKGCTLDLHPSRWRAGMCAQTTLGRTQVVLEQRADRTRVFVRPSFADYLVDWLAAAS